MFNNKLHSVNTVLNNNNNNVSKETKTGKKTKVGLLVITFLTS